MIRNSEYQSLGDDDLLRNKLLFKNSEEKSPLHEKNPNIYIYIIYMLIVSI